MKQNNRSEISEEFKWDLTSIFKSPDEFYKSVEELQKEVEDITRFKGKICESAEGLYEFLKFDEELDRKISRVYYYAHLNFDSDTTNTKYQEYYGRVENLLNKYGKLKSFVNPEMLLCDYKTIENYIETYPELKEFKHNLENFYRYQNHSLNEDEKRIVASLSNVLDTPEKTFEALTDSDMKFGIIKDEFGEECEFTESNWTKFIHSKDRDVRETAFKLLYETYSNYKNTIATTFKTNIECLCAMAKLNKFASSIEASLYQENISIDVYNNLIKTINDNLSILHKYYKIKKEILGLDELHLYDVYVPLENASNKEYSFEEAKNIIFEALKPLGEKYLNDLKYAFSERWIDIYNNKGKRGGAYSSGNYDTKPYVLLNYEGTLNDVSTLAHELGHSMHTYYSCKNNTYCNSSYELFVAEVASTVNELLLNKYLLNTADDNSVKLDILNQMMELFRTTIYRQTMFAEFEQNMHANFEKGTVLTSEYICDEYLNINKKYFGDDVVVDDLIKYEWMRIPHFYYNFYVYKYAIGLSCACYIVNNILNNEEGALKNYLKFLSLGGSDYPINELLVAGVDVTKSEVIDAAIKFMNETIDEYKKLKMEVQNGR